MQRWTTDNAADKLDTSCPTSGVHVTRLNLPPLVVAIALSLTGIFLLDTMGAMIKHLVQFYSPQQLSTLRNLFGLIPVFIVLSLSREWYRTGRPWKLKRWKLAFMRGIWVVFAQLCFYLSLAHLEFATTSTLVYASPLFVTALSFVLLGDPIGIWHWSAVAVGFVGVIIIIMGPGSDIFTVHAVLPVGAAFAYALNSVTVRLIKADVPSALINIYANAASVAGAAVLTLSTTGFVPIASAADWLWIIAMGFCGGVGVLCLVMAYRRTSPSNLAPFDYFGIIFAFVLGWVFYNEAPFDRLFPGVIFIVVGGLIMFWRERRLARRT